MRAIGILCRAVVVGSLLMTSALLPTVARAGGSSLDQAFSRLPLGEQQERERRFVNRHAPIVGMWITTFYIGPFMGPDTPVYDRGIQQFSSDGNELMGSAAFPPVTGNVCFGAWIDLGHKTFELRHIGWVFNTSNVFEGMSRLHVSMTVGPDGDSYSGTYTGDVVDADGNVLPGTAAEGDVRATRFGVEKAIAADARLMQRGPGFKSSSARSGC